MKEYPLCSSYPPSSDNILETMGAEPEITIFSGTVKPTFKASKGSFLFSRFFKAKSITLKNKSSITEASHTRTCTFRCTRGTSITSRSQVSADAWLVEITRNKTNSKTGRITEEETRQFAHLLGVEESQLGAAVGLLWAREDMVTLGKNGGLYVLKAPEGDMEWARHSGGGDGNPGSTFED